MERPVYGVVLTSGSQIKESPNFLNPSQRYVDEDGEFIFRLQRRVEPDLEGKIRLIPAIEALSVGKIDRLLIAGGARNHDIPLARIYTNWAKGFETVINIRRNKLGLAAIHEDSIVEVRGGVHTPSDLAKTEKTLEQRGWNADIILFSSNYQFLRRAVKDFMQSYSLGQVRTVSSDVEILGRHRLYPGIVAKVLPHEFIEEMIMRNHKIDKYPKIVENAAAYLVRAVKPEADKNKKPITIAVAVAASLAVAVAARKSHQRAQRAT